MGCLKELRGLTMIGKVPEGTCPECATKHDPKQPHNRDSLAYQYKFYDRHGHWPTWADAMAHCSEEIKKLWNHQNAKCRYHSLQRMWGVYSKCL